VQGRSAAPNTRAGLNCYTVCPVMRDGEIIVICTLVTNHSHWEALSAEDGGESIGNRPDRATAARRRSCSQISWCRGDTGVAQLTNGFRNPFHQHGLSQQ